jgi:hypothetical protein
MRGSSGSRWRPTACCSAYGDELWSYKKAGQVLNYLSDNCLLKKVFGPWSWYRYTYVLFDAKSSHSIEKLWLSPPSSLSYSNRIAKANSRLTKNQRTTSSLSVNSPVPLSNNDTVSVLQKQLVSVQVCIYVAKVLDKVCHVLWFTMHFKIDGEIFLFNLFRWQTIF